ncbi:MAG: OmpH family outer membrane protein [Proteobacteria bacterium]|nr:OmpH family outer membrane protein [Pseudomonadota bacterium]
MIKRVMQVSLAILITFALVLPAVAGTQKIGYANLQKALNECEAGRAAKESLQKKAEGLEADLNAKQEELKKMKAEIDSKRSIWNKETVNAKEELFVNKSRAFEAQFRAYNEEINSTKQAEEAAIIDEFAGIVEELAKKRGYTYVLERSLGGLLYASPDDDLTTEVIKIHNNRFSKRGR